MHARARVILIAVVLGTGWAAPSWGARTPPLVAVWAEVSANLLQLSSREGVAAMLDRAKAAGVTAVVPEAKNAWGFVAYQSAFAPHIRTLPVPRPFPPAYPPPNEWYPEDYDQLQVVIEEAHKRGIEVHAAINVFGEGLNAFHVGLAFERPEWQAQLAGDADRILPAAEIGGIAYVNPVHPEVQLYELAVIAEVVRQYDIDGVVLDRVRYSDIVADVSELSRERFEQWLGRRVAHWPGDLFRIEEGRLIPGPLFREWIAWRATIIQQFLRAAERVVHRLKPQVAFAAYFGGWYPRYWREGVNWAAADATPAFPWVTPGWRQAAVAEFFDYLMVGLYYPAVSRLDASRYGEPWWMSVEGGAGLAQALVGDATRPVGSLLLAAYEGNPAAFQAAWRAARRLTRGVMLFDLVYLDQYGWWDLLRGSD